MIYLLILLSLLAWYFAHYWVYNVQKYDKPDMKNNIAGIYVGVILTCIFVLLFGK